MSLWSLLNRSFTAFPRSETLQFFAENLKNVLACNTNHVKKQVEGRWAAASLYPAGLSVIIVAVVKKRQPARVDASCHRIRLVFFRSHRVWKSFSSALLPSVDHVAHWGSGSSTKGGGGVRWGVEGGGGERLDLQNSIICHHNSRPWLAHTSSFLIRKHS